MEFQDMAIIGSFTLKDGKFSGKIETLHINKSVTFQPTFSTAENAPSHRVFTGKAEIGAAWQKTAKSGLAYLSVKLDDPGFPAPVFASLFADEEGAGYSLVWNRS